MASVIITPTAQVDVGEMIANLGLPDDAWPRIARSLRILEDFPLAGRDLDGRWLGIRFLLGPWPWMILLYVYDKDADLVHVVAVHDARASTAPTSS